MLRPQRESVYIAKLGKELRLNFITLADDAWIEENWTDQELTDGLTTKNFNSEMLLALFWRALDDDGKKLVADAKLVKWEGLKSEVLEINDPVEKLKHLVSGSDELMAIGNAWINTRTKSNAEVIEIKKKKMMVELVSETSKSMTSSPQSMATKSKTSKSSQDETSTN
jgi:hypothetical protein